VRANGAADRAGLQEGENIDLPRYPELLGLSVGDVLDVRVIRDGHPSLVTIPLTGEAALVPQWRRHPPVTL
jgi:hypothetical protein